jgi:hypothetical protein
MIEILSFWTVSITPQFYWMKTALMTELWILCNVIVVWGIVILCINLMNWFVLAFSNLSLNFLF